MGCFFYANFQEDDQMQIPIFDKFFKAPYFSFILCIMLLNFLARAIQLSITSFISLPINMILPKINNNTGQSAPIPMFSSIT
jgi:hypothetical protein